ncbi:protein MULTIPOLAR SPINDLE [Trifolium repens]|nr:protein MULTIPOLAR SPINDLE [Trifolium repens]
MSLIMLSRDVRPWCGINSIAEFSDNNNHDDNDDNSLELESPLTHLVSKIEVKKRVISNESEFVKVTKKPKKLDFSNIVSSKGKSLEIFADESEGNDGLKMKKTRVSFHPSQTSHDASHCDLFHESASCKRYFFDNLGQLSPKHDRNDSDNRFNVVLRRRFLRQVRCKERRRRISSLSSSTQ